MTNKTTKRALLSSILALVLCVTMLVGSTFAWFTDTATTGVNTIVAGTLDVDLVDAKGDTLVGKTLDFIKADNADEAVLWEPGCTYALPEIFVLNKGDLAVKYQIVITGINGDAKLNEAIEWKITGLTGTLAAGATSKAVVIEGHMKETAGNEYMGLTIDGISITVLATQMTSEFDSYGNEYDADASNVSKWDGTSDPEGLAANTNEATKTVEIKTAAQFAAFRDAVNGTTNARAAANNYAGYTINLMTPIDLAGIDWAPIGATNGETIDSNPSYTFAGTFNGNGLTISNLSVESVGANAVAGLFGSANRATIKNVVIDGATIKSEHYAGGILAYETEYSNVIGCTVKNATITSSTNSTGDNGDKTGAIVGAMTGANANYAVAGNRVENVTLTAYRDCGGIIGFAAAGLRVEDNKLNNVTLIQDATDDYKFEKDGATPTTFGAVYGKGSPALNNNTESGVKINLKDAVITSQEGVNDSIANAPAGEKTEVVLTPGTYTLPAATNKDITVIGGKDTVIDTTAGMASTSGAALTFEGVTINFKEGGSYGTNGFTHSDKVVYKNCTLNGTQFLYSEAEFINCTFNVTGDVYAVWTYGSKNATFTDCTFNCDGKAVLVYIEAATVAEYTFNNCVFNDNGTISNKAAIEVSESANGNKADYTININGCTVNGFDVTEKKNDVEGADYGTNVWGNKNGITADRLDIIIDGTEVY